MDPPPNLPVSPTLPATARHQGIWWVSPLATLVAIVGLEACRHGWIGLRPPDPALVFVVVLAYGTSASGLPAGLASAALALVYLTFVDPTVADPPLAWPSREHLRRLVVPAVAAPGVVLLVGLLRLRLARLVAATQALRAAEALRTSEERLRHIVDSARDFAVIALDPAGRVTTWSAGSEAVFGWPAAEVLGRPAALIFTPEDRAAGVPSLELATARARGRAEDERTHVRRDGSRFEASGVMTAMRDAATGQLVGFSKVCRDLTGLRRVEETLRESSERFRALADNIAQLAWMADGGGAIVWYNRRWLDYTGPPPAAAQGWGWEEVHHPDHLTRVRDSYRRCVARGEVWEELFPLRGRDGGYRWFLSRAVPIRDEASRSLRWFGTNTDVTAQREAEQAARQAKEQAETANRLKDEFLATVSHELRSPLNAILGWTQLLRAAPEDPATRREALEIIERNSRAQVQLIEDLLDVSRIVTGKMRLEIVPVTLDAVVRAALEAVRSAAEAKGVRLESAPEPGPLIVAGDADRLQQVIWNLLANAVKFTPAGGRVQVRLERDATTVRVVVADTGLGIAPEFLPHVFDRFRQADSSSRRAHTGLGLGLALVRHLVELHGGAVTAASEGLGRGATFVVQLPRHLPPTVSARPVPSDPPGRPPAGSPHPPAGTRGLS